MSEGRDIEALIALIERRAQRPFDWRGRNDCVSFASRAVKAQTGIDARGHLRWKSRRAALAIISAEGGLEAAMDRRFDRVSCAEARRGDLAGVPDSTLGIRLMVVEGAMLVGPGTSGLERQPRGAMTIAWDAATARVPTNG